MKNTLTFVMTIIFSLTISAQIYSPGGVIQGTSSDNNVGIGTSNTVAKLSIQAGPDGYPTPLKAISIWGPNSPANSNSAQDLSWDFAAAGSAVIRSFRGAGYDTYLQFLTNNANNSLLGNAPEIRLHIHGNGNVGIGTTSPLAKLEINNGNILVRNSANVDNESSIMIAHSINAGNLDDFGTSIRTITQNAGNNTYGIQFFTKESYMTHQTEKLRILGNGNVGIGTVNPINKLDVNGTIHSKEVKVDMTGWSDYVFKKDYNLPTLQQVEKHIAEKGHLENIPNEVEVLKNGINLGDMNSKLLRKIEELTLYIIQQEKKNSLQTLEIENSKNEIEILKKENESFKNILYRLSKIEEKLK